MVISPPRFVVSCLFFSIGRRISPIIMYWLIFCSLFLPAFIMLSLRCSWQHFHANKDSVLSRFPSYGHAKHPAGCSESIPQLSQRWFLRSNDLQGQRWRKQFFGWVPLLMLKPLWGGTRVRTHTHTHHHQQPRTANKPCNCQNIRGVRWNTSRQEWAEAQAQNSKHCSPARFTRRPQKGEICLLREF